MFRPVAFLALLAFLAPACSKEIGDPCSTSVDCDQSNARDCDLSQPGGYCTINGCDEKSCPGEAVCIRIFPYEASPSACTQNSDCSGASLGVCQPGGFCGCSQDADCTSAGLCLPDGVCVPRASERRYCERGCGSNGDCRGGYLCKEAGIEGVRPDTSNYARGSIAFVANANPQSTIVKFCAPSP